MQYTGKTDEAADADARGIGMQIAAMRPRYLTRDEVPAEVVESERRIAEETAREEGKPEQALPKIVEGRVNSFFKDFVLLEQPSVVDNKKTVKQVADEAGLRDHPVRPVRGRPGVTRELIRWQGRSGTRFCARPPRHIRSLQRREGKAARMTMVTEQAVAVDDPAPPPVRPRRVVLKLSGEVFGGGAVGVDPDVVQAIARQIATVIRRGIQVAVVVGGGNFFRGAELQKRGMDRNRADYMGMLGTVMNCLALQDFLEKEGIETRVQTAITMAQVAEPYIPLRAIRHLEKGRVVIFGAGAGMPYFSTDTVTAQRALEIHADMVLMSKNGVDGVYTADPRVDPAAQKLDRITFQELLQRGLRVADQAAFSLCEENKLPMLVFGAEGDDTIVRAVSGEKIGTLITAVTPLRAIHTIPHHRRQQGGEKSR